jgi:hypothetical protein
LAVWSVGWLVGGSWADPCLLERAGESKAVVQPLTSDTAGPGTGAVTPYGHASSPPSPPCPLLPAAQTSAPASSPSQPLPLVAPLLASTLMTFAPASRPWLAVQAVAWRAVPLVAPLLAPMSTSAWAGAEPAGAIGRAGGSEMGT